MLRLAKNLWNDQAGFIVSAELVLISTVGVIGLVTGLTCLRNAVNSELSDVSCAIQSLDQSYCYTGFHSYKDKCSCVTKARTAGSTNVYTSYEAELVPVENVAPVSGTREGEIISEKVISERVISERVLEDQVIEQATPCEVCPTQTEVIPAPTAPEATPTPAGEAAPHPTPAQPAARAAQPAP